MIIMDAREYLERYRTAQHKADKLRMKYIEAVSDYENVSGGIVIGHGNSDINKPTEKKAERAHNAFCLWTDAQLKAVGIRQEIFEYIDDMCSPDSRVLWCRYLGLQSWDKVCEEIGLSRQCVFRQHRAALRHLQDILDTRE